VTKKKTKKKTKLVKFLNKENVTSANVDSEDIENMERCLLISVNY